jgi:hypothetical protein
MALSFYALARQRVVTDGAERVCFCPEGTRGTCRYGGRKGATRLTGRARQRRRKWWKVYGKHNETSNLPTSLSQHNLSKTKPPTTASNACERLLSAK